MNIHTQLFEAKKEIGAISKDSKNPFFKSKYFDINKLIEVIEPVLQKHEILLLQPLKDGVVTTILTTKDGKQSVESSMELPKLNDPQKLGSAITYFRRYTLQSLLGLQAEDDDASLASKSIAPTTTSVVLPALKQSQYDAVIASQNKEHAIYFLSKCSMTKEQREMFTKIKNQK